MKKRMTLVIIMVFVCLSCAGIYYTNSQKSIKNVHISTIDFPGYAGELSDDIKIKKNIEDSDITNMDNLKYIYTNDIGVKSPTLAP